jgi:putative transposase
MKKSRYTDTQIVNILKQNQAGESVANLCREYGMSQATFYKWRSKYDDALPSHATELFTSLFQ